MKKDSDVNQQFRTLIQTENNLKNTSVQIIDPGMGNRMPSIFRGKIIVLQSNSPNTYHRLDNYPGGCFKAHRFVKNEVTIDNEFNFSLPIAKLLQSFRIIVREEISAKGNNDLQEKMLSPAEACKLFQPNISKVTLAKWTSLGLIQDYRLGSRVYYKYSDLIESFKTLKKYHRSA